VILDPQGLVLAELIGDEGIETAVISPDEIEAVRLRNPALALRRYGVAPL
jgi:predicted amidohydrolase